MKQAARLLLFAMPFLIATNGFAQRQTFKANPDASKVDFALLGSGHHVQGTFHVQNGTITFDPSAHSIAGQVVVAAGSGNSGEASRDKKMNSEVLNSDQFTEITFAPKSYQGELAAKGDSNIRVTGVFTVHGAPHDLTVPMEIHIDGDNLTAKSHFVVPYVQWGMKDPSVFILKVAKQVDIDLNLTGQVSSGD